MTITTVSDVRRTRTAAAATSSAGECALSLVVDTIEVRKTVRKYASELTSLWQARQLVCAEAIEVVRQRVETSPGVFLVAQMRRMRVIREQRAMVARFTIRRHVY